MAMALTATGVAGFRDAMTAAFSFASVTTSAWAHGTAANATTAESHRTARSGSTRVFMVCPSSSSVRPAPRCQASPPQESPKNGLAGAAGARLEWAHDGGVRTVLPHRHGVRDLRRALDAPDSAGAPGRGAAVQRDPPVHP